MKIIKICLFCSIAHQAVALEQINLNQFIEKILKKSESVEIAHTELSLANQVNIQSRSQFFPTLIGQVQTTKVDSSDRIKSNILSSTHANEINTISSLKLSQNIFNGFRDIENLAYSKNQKSKSEFELSSVELSEVFNALQSYFEYIKAKKDLENIKKEIEYNQKTLAEINKNLSNGNARRSQVISLQSTIAANLVDQNEAESILLQIEIKFKSFLRIAENQSIDFEISNSNVSGEIDDLIKRVKHLDRPELKALEAEIASKENKLNSVKALRLPTLDFSSQYYLTDSSYTSVKNNYSLGLLLTIPFPFGDEKNSQIQQSALELGMSRIKLREKKRLLENDEDLLISSLKSVVNRLKILEEAKNIAERNIKYIRSDYTGGLASYSDYLNASTSYQQIIRKYDQQFIELQYLKLKALLWSGDWRNNLN